MIRPSRDRKKNDGKTGVPPQTQDQKCNERKPLAEKKDRNRKGHDRASSLHSDQARCCSGESIKLPQKGEKDEKSAKRESKSKQRLSRVLDWL